MDNLHGKGWLAREKDGKAYQYWPTLTREARLRPALRKIASRTRKASK